jgi:hypothetical protein
MPFSALLQAVPLLLSVVQLLVFFIILAAITGTLLFMVRGSDFAHAQLCYGALFCSVVHSSSAMASTPWSTHSNGRHDQEQACMEEFLLMLDDSSCEGAG